LISVLHYLNRDPRITPRSQLESDEQINYIMI